MKQHANAALSLIGRRRMVLRVVEDGCPSPPPARRRVGAAPPSVGAFGRHNRTEERTIEAIAALRRLRFTGPEIAEALDRPLSTVSGILTRIGMGRLGRLGQEPAGSLRARTDRAS